MTSHQNPPSQLKFNTKKKIAITWENLNFCIVRTVRTYIVYLIFKLCLSVIKFI